MFPEQAVRHISIHALCEEGDAWMEQTDTEMKHFYPRPLRGGRLPYFFYFVNRFFISIHALCEEGDSKNRDKISIFKQIIQHSARI